MQRQFEEARQSQSALLQCKLVVGTQTIQCPQPDPAMFCSPWTTQGTGNASYVPHRTPGAMLPEAIPLPGPSSKQQEQLQLGAQLFQVPDNFEPDTQNQKTQEQEAAEAWHALICQLEHSPPPHPIGMSCVTLKLCFTVVLIKVLFLVVMV